jgi:hypothetical protein
VTTVIQSLLGIWGLVTDATEGLLSVVWWFLSSCIQWIFDPTVWTAELRSLWTDFWTSVYALLPAGMVSALNDATSFVTGNAPLLLVFKLAWWVLSVLTYPNVVVYCLVALWLFWQVGFLIRMGLKIKSYFWMAS